MNYWNDTMSPQERVELRANAVLAVGNGERKSHVAQRLGITRQTLHSWVNKHRHGGTAALAAKPRGRTASRESAGFGRSGGPQQQALTGEGASHDPR